MTVGQNGKVKFKKEDDVDTIELLNKKLKQAVINEKYEDAAKIRDLIKSLESDKSN